MVLHPKIPADLVSSRVNDVRIDIEKLNYCAKNIELNVYLLLYILSRSNLGS